ncbi:MAG: hydroxymethylbilane synthase [Crocinitomicaceae bacterium TMED16]|nr:MAG: hydroxymethylbilane synthase [Crocinitomicaceae bacterium TMED16]|tara:strand:- start:820 stop:1716 length:897 start_codon:yes stop_codon:yes gene_type:complete
MPQTKPIIIGTRGSDLALWQANFVRKELEHRGHEVHIEIIKTQGDKIQDLSFDKMEGKGFFTKEIEDALLRKEIDLAVHSHKDLETNQPEGLEVAAVSSRANPCELLLIRQSAHEENALWGLKKDAIVGTSSARRKSQLLALRPDVQIKELRGNVPTRVEKLKTGAYDAILLAKAGILRLELDLSDLVCIDLTPDEFVPAPAQGVLALQVRSSASELKNILKQINDLAVQKLVHLERSVLNLMDGGCQLPLGVYCDNKYVHVAFSDDAMHPSRYFRFPYKDNPEFPQKIVEHLQHQQV